MEARGPYEGTYQVLRTFFPWALHLARQASGPALLPVPTGGMTLISAVLLTPVPSTGPRMSAGRLKSALARLLVPASSLERAEMSWAFSQPGIGISSCGLEGTMMRELTKVPHGVDACVWEDGHLSWSKGRLHGSDAVLSDHKGLGLTGHGDNVVGGSGVEVRWEHGAGAEVEHGHCQALAYCGGEGCPGYMLAMVWGIYVLEYSRIGVNYSTWGKSVLGLLGEVELPVAILGKELHAIIVGSSQLELVDQCRVGGHIDG
jgi:hypothetical protein